MSLDGQDYNERIFEKYYQNIENIVKSTQMDVEIYYNEISQLKKTITDIVQDNNDFNVKLEKMKTKDSVPESRDNVTTEQLTDNALDNATSQIDFLIAENNELRTIYTASKQTIKNLESEVQSYQKLLNNPTRLDETKQKFNNAILLLENTIKAQKTEIAKQNEIIRNLFDQRKQLQEFVKRLEKSLKEKNEGFNSQISDKHNVEKRCQESGDKIKELEKTISKLNCDVKNATKREKCALEKVQEALAIAEVAVLEKNNAQKRFQAVKEECDTLASTIGKVMDDAALKVEQDMQGLREEFMGKEKSILEVQKKMANELETQKKEKKVVDSRCKQFEEKLKSEMKTNVTLADELHSTAEALEKVMNQLQQDRNMIKKDKMGGIRAEEHEQEIQQYIEKNNDLKQKFRLCIQNLTEKFSSQIYDLQKENTKIKAQMQLMKFRIDYTIT